MVFNYFFVHLLVTAMMCKKNAWRIYCQNVKTTLRNCNFIPRQNWHM